MGADRTGAVRSRSHRDPLTDRVPGLRRAARTARRDRRRGKLEPRAILRCFGVALHETLHAKHTKRWAIEHDIALSESDDPADRQLAVDRRLLEEPRMEAHGVREFPPDSLRGRFVRRALQAAVEDVILPAFAGQVLELAAAAASR